MTETTKAPGQGGQVGTAGQTASSVDERTDIGGRHVVDYRPAPYRDRHHRRHVRALDRHLGRWS